jgi:hypothetical protein
VDHALRNALAVELRHLFDQLKILQQHGPARSRSHGILVVAYWPSSLRRQSFGRAVLGAAIV